MALRSEAADAICRCSQLRFHSFGWASVAAAGPVPRTLQRSCEHRDASENIGLQLREDARVSVVGVVTLCSWLKERE
jgi:hypothetical protein